MKTERLKRALALLEDQGITVEQYGSSQVILGEELKYVLTHSEMLELMDNDELTFKASRTCIVDSIISLAILQLATADISPPVGLPVWSP